MKLNSITFATVAGIVFLGISAGSGVAQSTFTLSNSRAQWSAITLSNNTQATFGTGSGLALSNNVYVQNASLTSSSSSTALIGWGGVINGDAFVKSYYQFNGVGSTTINFNQPFRIGTLTHYNYGIGAPVAETVDLKVRLTFSSPSGLPTPDFTFTIDHNETPNSTIPCPAGDTTPCADIVTVPDNIPDQFFTSGGQNFTLQFVGFSFNSNPSASGFSTTSQFISGEDRTNQVFLYGKIIQQPVPFELESAAGLLLVGVWGAYEFRRRKQSVVSLAQAEDQTADSGALSA